MEYAKATCKILSNPNKLAINIISMPSAQRQRIISNYFLRTSSVPNMVGILDGSHIKLLEKPPIEFEPAANCSRHNIHSVGIAGDM